MTNQTEHVDSYGQRYVTTTQLVTNGLQIITEIYTPYIYGKEVEIRFIEHQDGSRSIDVFGIITNISQIFSGLNNTVLIAEGIQSEESWIEVWRNCLTTPRFRFAHTIDCCMIDMNNMEISSGSAFVSVNSANGVVWADVDAFGTVLSSGTNIALEFIDVWS